MTLWFDLGVCCGGGKQMDLIIRVLRTGRAFSPPPHPRFVEQWRNALSQLRFWFLFGNGKHQRHIYLPHMLSFMNALHCVTRGASSPVGDIQKHLGLFSPACLCLAFITVKPLLGKGCGFILLNDQCLLRMKALTIHPYAGFRQTCCCWGAGWPPKTVCVQRVAAANASLGCFFYLGHFTCFVSWHWCHCFSPKSLSLAYLSGIALIFILFFSSLQISVPKLLLL